MPPHSFDSLLAEGLAVGALIHGGIYFMGTDQDLVQRAVVCLIAVVGALVHSTFDAFIGIAIHSLFSSFSCDDLSMRNEAKTIQKTKANH